MVNREKDRTRTVQLGAEAEELSPRPVLIFPTHHDGPKLYALHYPPFFSKGHRVNPRLIAQLFAACAALFLLGWMYMGATWDPKSNLYKLEIAVLSCDTGVAAELVPHVPPSLSAAPLGSQLLAISVYNPSSPVSELLGWKAFVCVAAGADAPAGTCGSAHASLCRSELLQAIDDGKYWSGLFVPATFTTDVLSSVPAFGMTQSQASFEHVYGAGRSSSTYSFIKGVVAATTSVSIMVQPNNPHTNPNPQSKLLT